MGNEEESRILSEDEVNQLLNASQLEGSIQKIKILVVEDNPTTRILYDKGLFDQVFDKKLVASGMEAMRIYAEWQPDIIVLDIFLAEMTGYQVLREIRTTLTDLTTTIVMATALSSRDDVLSCIKLGADGYITKPFRWSEIAIKTLSYYAKREPDQAKKAAMLCNVAAKHLRIQSLLQEEKPKMKQGAEVTTSTLPDDKTTGDTEHNPPPTEAVRAF